ncbi:unnamed protein product, partial [Prorocentrum cordatum]
ELPPTQRRCTDPAALEEATAPLFRLAPQPAGEAAPAGAPPEGALPRRSSAAAKESCLPQKAYAGCLGCCALFCP